MDFVSSLAVDAARVVITEDDPVIAGTLSWLLREHGYAVTAVGDCDAMFASIARTVPDLILIDCDSIADSSALFRRLRNDSRWNEVRVIVTAPVSSDDDASAQLPWGADDAVSKPFRVSELLVRVRTQLRASEQLRETRASLRQATEELERVRGDAVSSRRLVDILHDVTSELSASGIYRVLVKRVAQALAISHCSVVLARPEDGIGVVVSSFEDATVHDFEIRLERYPEMRAAIETGRSVLVEDVRRHELFASLREQWARDGTAIDIQSVATIPFSIDRLRAGVLFLRTDFGSRRLTSDDVAFGEVVIRAAVAAIRRAQALDTTRADNRRLEALATTDPLTRVLNRRALLDRLATELDRSRRYSSALTLLLIDVDHFKQINDTSGHQAGDHVLRLLAALLEADVRKVDIVARYGGEEFVVILPETSNEGGVAFAERLCERIAAEPFEVGGGREVHLTVSIGIATFPSQNVDTTEELFARADEALYRAKSGGRNQVRA